jgi:hypothetical protein
MVPAADDGRVEVFACDECGEFWFEPAVGSGGGSQTLGVTG